MLCTYIYIYCFSLMSTDFETSQITEEETPTPFTHEESFEADLNPMYFPEQLN